MTCEPENVTGLVDGALEPPDAERVAAHVEGCEPCQAQRDFELGLRERLAALERPELPPGLEQRIRARARRSRRHSPVRWLLPLAACLIVFVWARGLAPVVAWELARDHDECFAHDPLPAQIWSGDPDAVLSWFREHGSEVPLVPAAVDGLALVGARHCPLPGLSMAPHLYYASQDRQLSLFVVPRNVRIEDGRTWLVRGHPVHLMRVAGLVVGVVGDRTEDVQAFADAFGTSVAAVRLAPRPRTRG